MTLLTTGRHVSIRRQADRALTVGETLAAKHEARGDWEAAAKCRARAARAAQHWLRGTHHLLAPAS
jgi:hypothetical protein